MSSNARSLVRLAAVTFALLANPMAHAQEVNPAGDPRSPVDQYRAATQVGLAQCKVAKALAKVHADAGEPQEEASDYAACLRALKPRTDQAMHRVLKTVKKAKLKQAITAYGKVFAGALAGVPPLKDESNDDYEQRQLAWVNQVNAAWEEVENQR
ncbi:MAG: hypothetical protein RI907_1125 [Pseudomonadota bacterium]|jgi:hypothetical protein